MGIYGNGTATLCPEPWDHSLNNVENQFRKGQGCLGEEFGLFHRRIEGHGRSLNMKV